GRSGAAEGSPAAGTARVRCAARARLSANRSTGSRRTSAPGRSISTSAAATDNRRHREATEGNDKDASSDACPISLRPLRHTHEGFHRVHLTLHAHFRSDSVAVALHGDMTAASALTCSGNQLFVNKVQFRGSRYPEPRKLWC